MREKFEYKMASYSYERGVDKQTQIEHRVAWLNTLGAEGWEVVSVFVDEYLFKRRVVKTARK
jgi:hypothetical protein